MAAGLQEGWRCCGAGVVVRQAAAGPTCRGRPHPCSPPHPSLPPCLPTSSLSLCLPHSYNTVMKITFLATAFQIVRYMRFHKVCSGCCCGGQSASAGQGVLAAASRLQQPRRVRSLERGPLPRLYRSSLLARLTTLPFALPRPSLSPRPPCLPPGGAPDVRQGAGHLPLRLPHRPLRRPRPGAQPPLHLHRGGCWGWGLGPMGQDGWVGAVGAAGRARLLGCGRRQGGTLCLHATLHGTAPPPPSAHPLFCTRCPPRRCCGPSPSTWKRWPSCRSWCSCSAHRTSTTSPHTMWRCWGARPAAARVARGRRRRGAAWGARPALAPSPALPCVLISLPPTPACTPSPHPVPQWLPRPVHCQLGVPLLHGAAVPAVARLDLGPHPDRPLRRCGGGAVGW